MHIISILKTLWLLLVFLTRSLSQSHHYNSKLKIFCGTFVINILQLQLLTNKYFTKNSSLLDMGTK